MFRFFGLRSYYVEFTDRNEQNCKTIGEWTNERNRVYKLINQKLIPANQMACAYEYANYCNNKRIERFSQLSKIKKA
jgi:hypothetical protein